MTKEEAVLILDPDNSEAALARLEYYAGFGGEEAELRIIRDACRLAVKALRGTTTGEPLALEQLREMDGKPVWVEFEDGSGGLWGIVHISVFEQIVFPNGLHCTIGHPYYGKTYKAYAYPPAHIDREAWTAEWKSRESPWNGYTMVCSKCGETIKSLSGQMPFCPSCGRAMTPKAWAELEKRLRGWGV